VSASPEVVLEPRVLEWARARVGLSEANLADKVGIQPARVVAWERTGRITLSQADRLAKATYTPVGYLYLTQPPAEQLPVTDFRVVGDERPEQPSANLLAVLDDATLRQDWYREYLVSTGADPLDFVGSLSENVPVPQAAAMVRERHELSVEQRQEADSWDDALRLETGRIEKSGVLVMRSGIVGSNTRRPLAVKEFRGFAMADSYSPLIFINGRDARPAQIFTLLHELVHLWLGQSGVSNFERTLPSTHHSERFCNAVAAEILVPEDSLRHGWADVSRRADSVTILSRMFKVSGLVILRRLYDAGFLDWATFRSRYVQEEHRYGEATTREKGGGDFYRTQQTRLSSRFIDAVIESALEGRTSSREAYPLLGIKTTATFREVANRRGFTV
jgi:Zn-dependent peptidase ImmA (M78 family)